MIVNTPKHNDDDVEFGANWYCNDAVMSGEDPSGIQTRLTWVMANRSAIARMPQKAQWECVKEMIFGSSRDCFNHPLEFTRVPAPASQADAEQAAQALDAKFQQMPMWIVVKREFPVWYSEQIKQAATLLAQKQPQVAINKHLAEALVALRRQHAQEALLARTDKLKAVASAFLDNLKSLSKRGGGACYAFITQGETAPVVLEMMQSIDGATVQAQVAAIFDAIADGRMTPTQHEKAVKTDYEVLTQELSKLGWKQNDLKVFSDPQALSHEPPSRVCQMVQDWFTAHLAVADKATQERLLVETLKPVVSG